jgi:hypothetical protein
MGGCLDMTEIDWKEIIINSIQSYKQILENNNYLLKECERLKNIAVELKEKEIAENLIESVKNIEEKVINDINKYENLIDELL